MLHAILHPRYSPLCNPHALKTSDHQAGSKYKPQDTPQGSRSGKAFQHIVPRTPAGIQNMLLWSVTMMLTCSQGEAMP